MEYLLDYDSNKLKQLNIDNLRLELYKCEDVTDDTYDRLYSMICRYNLMRSYSSFLDDYYNQIKRLENIKQSKNRY